MSEYVTNAAWLRLVSRPDVVDDVADQFERPGPVARGTDAATQLAHDTQAAWPRRSRGWRSADRLHRHLAERQAARG